MPDQITKLARQAIEQKLFPGCVIGIISRSGKETLPFGRFTYQSDSPQVQEDTIYDLASVTKSIPTASLAALFLSDIPPRLNLGDKVKKYLPELQNDFDATIEDLLRYRVRGAALSQLQFETFEQLRTYVFEHGFDGPPGEYAYTNLPAFLLGIILERVSGEILPALAHKHFFEPLHMHDTTFFPHDLSRIAPTEIIGGTEIRGVVHDESARLFATRRRAVGHAGLFSTASDLLHFLEMLLKGGPLIDSAEEGLGWQVNEPWMGHNRSKKAFGKTGFTGTSVLIDREKGLGLVILSNRTYPVRPRDRSAIDRFRADVADLVFAQL